MKVVYKITAGFLLGILFTSGVWGIVDYRSHDHANVQDYTLPSDNFDHPRIMSWDSGGNMDFGGNPVLF